MSASAITSETANRPPGRSTRAASASTLGLSPERLITQLEITTSTLASGSGSSSRYPLRNSTFSTPASAALRLASSSISSVMSIPIARPVEPTRRAEISTSAPAPEPRSSTTSPSCRSATAVGTPHPSDAPTAPSGTSSVSAYNAEPNTPVVSAGLQHPAAAPAEAACAAAAYFSRTVSRTCSTVAVAPDTVDAPAEQPHPLL